MEDKKDSIFVLEVLLISSTLLEYVDELSFEIELVDNCASELSSEELSESDESDVHVVSLSVEDDFLGSTRKGLYCETDSSYWREVL